MRSHSFQVFDHAPTAHLPSLQLVPQRLGAIAHRALGNVVPAVFTLAAAAVLSVLAILLKR